MRLVSCLCFASLVAAAADPLAERIDELMKPCSGDVPGGSVIVIRDGKPVFRKSYGLASLEHKEAATPATNYRLASVTKQFTAMSILILTERGKLRLDQRLNQFLPELPAWSRQITIRHLLTHTSGIPPYERYAPDIPPDKVTPANQLRDRDVIDILKHCDKLEFAPGEKYQYSNTGYVVLGVVVAKVSGMSFPDFLQRNIFSPLGMNHTVMHVEGRDTVAHRAYGHVPQADGKFLQQDQSVTSATLGDGGIYSSLDDLSCWDQALYTDKLVRRETLQQAVTSARLNNGSATNYGFGWELGTRDGHAYWSHSGGTMGFNTYLLRYPQDRLTVIVLLNRNGLDTEKLAREIAALYLAESR